VRQEEPAACRCRTTAAAKDEATGAKYLANHNVWHNGPRRASAIIEIPHKMGVDESSGEQTPVASTIPAPIGRDCRQTCQQADNRHNAKHANLRVHEKKSVSRARN
jgi:hypothetical protein